METKFIEVTELEKHILDRKATLEKELEKFIIDANKQIFAYQAVIGELEHLLHLENLPKVD